MEIAMLLYRFESSELNSFYEARPHGRENIRNAGN
jgi:hypothetical protein